MRSLTLRMGNVAVARPASVLRVWASGCEMRFVPGMKTRTSRALFGRYPTAVIVTESPSCTEAGVTDTIWRGSSRVLAWATASRHACTDSIMRNVGAPRFVTVATSVGAAVAAALAGAVGVGVTEAVGGRVLVAVGVEVVPPEQPDAMSASTANAIHALRTLICLVPFEAAAAERPSPIRAMDVRGAGACVERAQFWAAREVPDGP